MILEKSRTLFFAAAFLSLIPLQAFAASPVIGTERARGLRTLETAPMLFEYHRQTVGDERQFFTYPRRDTTFIKRFVNTEGKALLYYDNLRGGAISGHGLELQCHEGDTSCVKNLEALRAGQLPKFAIATSIVGGIDYRGGEYINDIDNRRGENLGDTIWPGIDGGIYLRGYADSLEFVLDARIYDEGHSAKKSRSWDHEFLEVQKEENNSGVEYTSYARYRTHFAFNYDWIRVDLARDVLHWGPGYYNNLSLNQFALPYNMLSVDLQFGPLRVFSFYGDLRIVNNSMSMDNKEERNVFGHRYELAIGNGTFGISELTVLYDNLKPWLFVPTVPLFMEKGNYSENTNNGSLAFDFNYRLFNTARIYTEFFLDDMESPISLIKNDNIEAKWAWMAGFQAGHNFYLKGHLLEVGTLAEYARVEPYVYSHFEKNTAQIAHLGYPLGNQGGPNSQTIDWNVYARLDKHIFASLRNTWFWKGTDYGSAVNDTTPRRNHMKTPKKFLDGAKMQYSLTPAISYEGQYVSFMGEITFIDDRKAYLRAGFKW
ncbi:MAG: hypothetical protein IK012_11310 [Fibrobacter sp.]|uniref:hypothetical protein n=1 Tax=Fibrobacter sp. TaxID=35828 RepID=UPI0025BAC8DF|nr:hypothetical protein [Fibrobacter sp.]MBR4785819.1 hypothetical protein [Fibrobacter sp.]